MEASTAAEICQRSAKAARGTEVNTMQSAELANLADRCMVDQNLQENLPLAAWSWTLLAIWPT